jgi:hypothetical protein
MLRKVVEAIPDDFAVRPLKKGDKAESKATCGHCGLSWDDAIVTDWTPASAGRCPFEYFHIYPDDLAPPRPRLVDGRKVQNVVITGRRWFDGNAGNTYHSATVYVNGIKQFNTGRHYGYDEQYLHTAAKQLEKLVAEPNRMQRNSQGVIVEACWQWMERINVAFSYEVVDVKRKSDLG